MINIDFETYSEANLKDVGGYEYSVHPSTEIMMLAFRIRGDQHFWMPGMGDEPLAPLFASIAAGEPIHARNAFFEQCIWDNSAVQKMGWPVVEPTQWRCSMASSAYKALPLGLDECGDAIGVGERKDKSGHTLMMKLSRPKTKFEKGDRGNQSPPEELLRLADYCIQDTVAEAAIADVTGELPAPELDLWHLDQKINMRGVTIDLDLAYRCKKLMMEGQERANLRIVVLTDGLVQSTDKLRDITSWLAVEHDVCMPNMQKATVDETIEHWPDLPAAAKEVLELRRDFGKAGVKKVDRMIMCANEGDHRARGLLQYHGATTGRWAGRLIQPQNMPRPTFGVRARDFLDFDYDTLEVIYGSVPEAISNLLRGLIIAAKGKKLVSADLAGVEARGLAWLFREEWKLEAFRKCDRGEGPNAYCLFGEKIFGRPVSKADKVEYATGKVGELAFGYQGGLGAWLAFDSSGKHTDKQINGYKDDWRELHPRIVEGWKQINRAFIVAVDERREVSFGRITFGVEGDWGYCILPSERKIWYYKPRIEMQETPWGTDAPGVVFWAYKQTGSGGRSWQRIRAYGGLLVENIIQAMCRDVMVECMWAAEAAGLPIVLTVHDELVCEVDADDPDALNTLLEIMRRPPSFAPDWPAAAEGWEGKRYRK